MTAIGKVVIEICIFVNNHCDKGLYKTVVLSNYKSVTVTLTGSKALVKWDYLEVNVKLEHDSFFTLSGSTWSAILIGKTMLP